MKSTPVSAMNPFARLRARWRRTPRYVRLSLAVVSVLTGSLLLVAGENHRLRQENTRNMRDIEGLAVHAGALELENAALKARAVVAEAGLRRVRDTPSVGQCTVGHMPSFFEQQAFRIFREFVMQRQAELELLRAENAALDARLRAYEIRDEQRQHPSVSQPPPGMR